MSKKKRKKSKNSPSIEPPKQEQPSSNKTSFFPFSNPNTRRNFLYVALILTVFVVGCAVLSVVKDGPAYSGAVFAWIAIGVFLIAFWRYKNYTYLPLKLLYWTVFAFCPVFLLTLGLMPLKYWLLFAFCFVGALSVATIVLYIRMSQEGVKKRKEKKRGEEKKNSFISIGVMLLGMAIFSFVALGQYNFYETWKVALIGGGLGLVVGGVVILWLCLGGYRYMRWTDGVTDRNGAEVIVFTLLIGAALGYAFVAVPNVAFDGESCLEVCEVVDKDEYHGSRGSRSYYLYIEINGEEIQIDVDADSYEQTSIGDMVEVETYEGALGFAYVYLP